MLGELELEYELEGEYELETEWESELEAQARGESEVIPPFDTRVHVSNTRLAPYRYICHLVHAGSPAGTGTLIAPNVVLTCAHVLWNKTADRQKDAARMVVIPGRNADRRRGDIRPFGTAQALSFHFAPGYRGRRDNVTRNDYAVVYLQTPIGRTVGHWTVAHTSSPRDPLGTSISAAPLPMPLGHLKVNLSGYPRDKGFDFGTPPQPLRQQWRAYNRAMLQRDGMLHYLNDTGRGQSGGPVWVKRDASLGGRVMVGIHAGGDDRGRPNATPIRANRGIRITRSILNDIQRWLRAAPRVINMPPIVITVRPFRVLEEFQHNQPQVPPRHLRTIDEIARRIVGGRPPVHTVRLVGHTDNSGSDAYNLDLGRRRAASVQPLLVAAIDRLRPGHSRSVQIVVQSLGEARPIAPNTTPQGRARNRRVEVFLAGR